MGTQHELYGMQGFNILAALTAPAGAHPGRQRFRLRGGFRLAVFGALWMSLSFTLGACAGAGLKRGPSGLSPRLVEQASLVVGQTRAQFPQHSGKKIPYQIRESRLENLPPPELALRGAGISMTPGLQDEVPKRISLSLFVDKVTYTDGYLEVKTAGGEEVWPIIAFDHTGRADGVFGFTYLLATPLGRLRYLVVIGGGYREKEQSYFGFEGTLIHPEPGKGLEKWKRAYKIDFGYKFPSPPVFPRKVAAAEKLFGELQGEVRKVERLQNALSEARSSFASLQKRPQGKSPPGEREKTLTKAKDDADSLEESLVDRIAATEAKFHRYYRVRRELAVEFSKFLETNYYLWRDLPGKQELFDQWKAVERHHDRIDLLVLQFMNHLKEKQKLDQARRTAMKVITANNNWGKNPGRGKRTPPPR
ncbi:MAG: hypothetical protein V3S64_17905 [bacterium]